MTRKRERAREGEGCPAAKGDPCKPQLLEKKRETKGKNEGQTKGGESVVQEENTWKENKPRLKKDEKKA